MASLILDRLDPEQRQAVTAPDGAVLVLAGAGSGKTGTLTARVWWLISRHEPPVPAREIMAVTFTRKAAQEMRDRLAKLLPPDEDYDPIAGLRVGTFHAQMSKLLRRNLVAPALIEFTGRSQQFSIWDEDDRLRAVKRIMKATDEDEGKPARVVAAISRWKNEGKTHEEPLPPRSGEAQRAAHRAWPAYEVELRKADAFDFDDLLTVPVAILSNYPAIRAEVAGGIRHLLVDEAQDVNEVQATLVDLLGSVHKNWFVVGDSMQSIYGFRGAQVEHIRRFAERHPGTVTVMLTTNYRSGQAILDVANHILGEADQEIDRLLRARAGATEVKPPRLIECGSERTESEMVVRQIADAIRSGTAPREIAVLMRLNSQSRLVESALLAERINYRVIGGLRFAARAEIRDALSYLRALVNNRDAAAYRRALAAPAGRGIGSGLIERVAEAAFASGDWRVALRATATSGGGTAKGRASLEALADLLDVYTNRLASWPMAALVEGLISGSGLDAALEHDEAAATRRDNLAELVAAANEMPDDTTLSTFIEHFSLTESGEEQADTASAVLLSTIHGMKGAEATCVFVIGCDEGMLPLDRAVEEGSLEEERRLAYVAVTRAKRQLTLTFPRYRVRSAGGEGRASQFFEGAIRAKHLTLIPFRPTGNPYGVPGSPSSFGPASSRRTPPRAAPTGFDRYAPARPGSFAARRAQQLEDGDD